MTKRYSSNLSDKEWKMIEPLLQRPYIKNGGRKNAGRKPKYEARVMIDAIFYVLRSGCAWHLLPGDFPPWQTVYARFQKWQRSGAFLRIHDHVRSKLREALGRAKHASAGSIDSQSVKTTEKGGSVDMTRAKKSKGGKGISPSTQRGFSYRRMLRARPRAINTDAKNCCAQKG